MRSITKISDANVSVNQNQPPGTLSTMIGVILGKLSLAFPVQSRKFSNEEAQGMNDLWTEIFIDTNPVLLHEAVTKFITANRTGFFPSPGQIMEFVVEIQDEQHWREVEMRLKKRNKEYEESEKCKRLETAKILECIPKENCSNCGFGFLHEKYICEINRYVKGYWCQCIHSEHHSEVQHSVEGAKKCLKTPINCDCYEKKW